MALTGGPAVTILNTGLGGSSGATWAPDDTIIFATPDPATGLQRVSAGGGDVAVLTRPAQARGELDHLWPEMLPGGRAVLFTITATTGGPDAAQVAVLDLATGTPRVLMRGGSHAHYVPSGHLVYTAGGTLRAVPFDLARLETRGTPVTVLPRLVTKPQGAAEFVVAADGTLAYVDAPDFAAAANTLVWVDRQGREKSLAAPAGPYTHPRLSPDGMRVAVARGGERHLGVGSRTPDGQPTDVRFPGQTTLRCGRRTGIACSSSRRLARPVCSGRPPTAPALPRGSAPGFRPA